MFGVQLELGAAVRPEIGPRTVCRPLPESGSGPGPRLRAGLALGAGVGAGLVTRPDIDQELNQDMDQEMDQDLDQKIYLDHDLNQYNVND